MSIEYTFEEISIEYKRYSVHAHVPKRELI